MKENENKAILWWNIFQNWGQYGDTVELISRHCEDSCESIYLLDLPHAQKFFSWYFSKTDISL